jgi:hypothetical protein
MTATVVIAVATAGPSLKTQNGIFPARRNMNRAQEPAPAWTINRPAVLK